MIGGAYGIAIGAVGPLHGVILGLCFGRTAFGRANGIGSLVTATLLAIAPLIAGWLYDTTGDYLAVFGVQAAALLAAGALLQLVRIPHAEPGASGEPGEAPAPADASAESPAGTAGPPEVGKA